MKCARQELKRKTSHGDNILCAFFDVRLRIATLYVRSLLDASALSENPN